MATAELSQEVMTPGREVAKSHRLVAMLRIPDVVPELPQKVFMARYLTNHTENFKIYLQVFSKIKVSRKCIVSVFKL